MIAAEIVKPGAGDAVFQYLSPGAGLLARWIAVFFVPGLAMLPNAPSMGNAFEVRILIFSTETNADDLQWTIEEGPLEWRQVKLL
jgi:hypothetical protein